MATLAIEDKFNLPIKFYLKEGAVNKLHTFTLLVERKTTDEIKEFSQDTDRSIVDFMVEVTSGWSDMRLVREGDAPADFSKDNFKLLLTLAGVAKCIWEAYLPECGAKAKN
jgi:hypothetical protein